MKKPVERKAAKGKKAKAAKARAAKPKAAKPKAAKPKAAKTKAAKPKAAKTKAAKTKAAKTKAAKTRPKPTTRPAPARRTKEPTLGPAERALLARIDATGWFDCLPAAAAREYRAGIEAELALGDASEPLDALAIVRDEAESIEAEGDYTTCLQPFIRNSFGLFRPEAVEEVWQDGRVRFGFTLDGRRFEASFAAASDWVDDAFLDLLARALPEVGRAYGFRAVDAGDPCYAFALTSEAAFAAAVREGLVRSPDEAGPAEEDDAEGADDAGAEA